MPGAYTYDGNRFQPLDWQAGRALRWADWRQDGSGALLVGNAGSVFFFDGQSLRTLLTGDRQNLRGAAWSPSGADALLVGNAGAVYHLQGEEITRLPPLSSENLRRVAWHPAGEFALVIGNAGTVLRFDAGTGRLAPLPGDRAHTLRSIAFAPSGEYALVGAFASRWAGYPRPHSLYRCDGRYLQALLASEDEDDIVAVTWRADGLALACGYAIRADGVRVNKAVLYDGSVWRAQAWSGERAILGGGWQPQSDYALVVGEAGLALKIGLQGELTELDTGTQDNLMGPFWRPDGSYAIVLKGPSERVYTV